jgi:hypothetical protein
MKILSNVLYYYLILVLIAFYIKPLFLFKPNGKLREYGVGKDFENYDKTFFNFLTVSVFLIFLLVKFTKTPFKL